MNNRFGGNKVAEMGLPGWNWGHEVKNQPWEALIAEGIGAFFNTLLTGTAIPPSDPTPVRSA